MQVMSLEIRERPAQWRLFAALAALGLGLLAAGLGLLILQGGNLLGLVPGVPGGLLIYGAQRSLRNAARSGRVLCDALLTGSLLRIDGHDVQLERDYFVVFAQVRFLTMATFVQGGQERVVAWPSRLPLMRPHETGARAERRLRGGWQFEGELHHLLIGHGNLGPALLSALEANSEHDQVEVLRGSLEALGLAAPDPSQEHVVEIADGSLGRSMPYRIGKTTPEHGQRFLDDFRGRAFELAPGVHVDADYVCVQEPGTTTVIPVGKVTAETDGRSVVVKGENGELSVDLPDRASAEVVGHWLRQP